MQSDRILLSDERHDGVVARSVHVVRVLAIVYVIEIAHFPMRFHRRYRSLPLVHRHIDCPSCLSRPRRLLHPSRQDLAALQSPLPFSPSGALSAEANGSVPPLHPSPVMPYL